MPLDTISDLHIAPGRTIIPGDKCLLVDGTPSVLMVPFGADGRIINQFVNSLVSSSPRQKVLADLPEEHRRTANKLIRALIRAHVLLECQEVPAEPSARELFFNRASIDEDQTGLATPGFQKATCTLLFTPCDQENASALADLLSSEGEADLGLFLCRGDADLRSFLKKSSHLSNLVSLVATRESMWLEDSLSDHCQRTGQAFLRLQYNGQHRTADVGPFFTHHQCKLCFDAMHPLFSRDPPDVLTASDDFPILYWLSRAAMEVLTLTHAPERALSRYGALRLNMTSGAADLIRCTRLPECDHVEHGCQNSRSSSQSGGANPFHTTSALVYEDYVRVDATLNLDKKIWEKLPPHWLIHTPDRRYRASPIIRLQSETLLSPTARVLLERGEPLDASNTFAEAELASILAFTARSVIHEGQTTRAAPTAGNLGSVDLFVLVRSMQGLEPGAYFYDGGSHSLVALQFQHHSRDMVEELSALTGKKVPDLPELVLVFVGVLTRLMHKYGAFAYKLLHLDAGVSLQQSQLSCRGLSINCCPRMFWDDKAAADILGLSTPTERVTAMLEIRVGKGPVARSVRVVNEPVEEFATNWTVASEFANASAGSILERILAESAVTRCSKDGGLTFPKTPAARNHATTEIRLKRGVLSSANSSQPLKRERSYRHFSPAPVALDDLSTLLTIYKESLPSLKPEGPYPLGMAIWIAAAHIDGLERSLYEYSAENHSIIMRKLFNLRQYRRLFLQEDVRSAPLLLFCTTSILDDKLGHAEWNHRKALVQAGASLSAISFGAGAIGLRSCYLGALAGRELPSYAGSLLCALVIGHPVQNRPVNADHVERQ